MAEFYPSAAKRRKIEVELTEEGIMELCVRYNKREFDTMRTPKTVLLDYTRSKHLKPPAFFTVSTCIYIILYCECNTVESIYLWENYNTVHVGNFDLTLYILPSYYTIKCRIKITYML